MQPRQSSTGAAGPTRRGRITRSVGDERGARVMAAVLTALVLAAPVIRLFDPTRPAPAAASTLQVVMLALPAPPSPPPPVVMTPSVPVPTLRARPRSRAPDRIVAPTGSAADAPAEAPEFPARPLDYGSLLGADTSLTFAERRPGQRDTVRTPFDSPPGRFRMRRQVTPEDVLRGFARLVGLWPPGYTASPCPALRRLVETTPDAPSPRELALLQDAVLARERFCR
ncbi:hypothetical protein [Luteimonas deserti]|uniref:Uncharacterized protein n=1 Tax=Luteimonas deserti TaxID=2752306 RepID=A0A7Z0QRL1_9GAMM|nr:hypothetical protein [Luteimonas deserti]NYZ62686.1 hypothetical protein [Luteimonas deserti]